MTTTHSKGALAPSRPGCRLAVEPGFVDPALYVVTDEGCHLWLHAVLRGVNGRETPVVHRQGRAQNVRRLLVPEIKANQVIRLACGHDRCVNPAHFVVVRRQRIYRSGVATGRGKLDAHGLPKPGSYVVTEEGCHLWTGHLDAANKPEATYRGKNVRVRQQVLRCPPGSVVKSTCGHDTCVNPAHLYRPAEIRAWRLAHERREKLALNAARGHDPEAKRDLRWVRADLAALAAASAQAAPDPLTPKQRWAVEQFAQGFSLQALARAAGVTHQAISYTLKGADRKLRKWRLAQRLQQ